MKSLSGERYIALETYRRGGTPVRTTVWFVEDGQKLYIRTPPNSGKAKRMSRNPRVRAAPCTFSGEPKTESVEMVAKVASPDDANVVSALFGKKYGIQKWGTDIRARLLRKEYRIYSLEPVP